MTRESDALACGLAALTGTADGPPLVPPGRAATVARELGQAFRLDGSVLLTERAALQGLHRRAPWSAGGSCRAVRCADGWAALSLGRPWDRDAVPALVERPVDGDPWDTVDAWAAVTPVGEVVARGELIGLALAEIPTTPLEERPVRRTRLAPAGEGSGRPLVVCLASLWAGPLAAHLLGLSGADVVFVESRDRPDPVRLSCPPLHALLHRGAATVVLDLPAQVEELRVLLRRADVVIEGSRPRVLAQWGLHPEVVLAESPTTWVSITAHGREQGHRVGFGDDAAMAGGQVVWSADGTPWPVGDALGDPLAGLWAGVTALQSHRAGGGVLLDVALRRVAASATGPEAPIAVPGAPAPQGRA